MKLQLKEQVQRVIGFLVAGRYSELESLTNGIRVSAQEMATAIADYGRNLVSPPEEAFRLMDVVEVPSADPPRWSITMPLWTREEGRSDLSIELTVIVADKGFTIELDDIHVL